MGKKVNINKSRNRNAYKRQRKKLSLSHVILAVVFIYVVVTFIKQELVIRDLKEKDQLVGEELKSLKEDVKDLGKKIDKAETIEYIEKIAREELDMIKPHEIIYKDKNKQDDSSNLDWQRN